ncbi:hypothetical protein BGW41_006084 [Actinomortierella wolfii]|nr:hypothetical protein BGW41_006084 [Actinomortierella wolfii]
MASTAVNAATAVSANGTTGGATQAAPTTEVWSSLLQSVSSSKHVPIKNILILGDPHSGKSTLIEQLKSATALPNNSQDAMANGKDGSGLDAGAAANGVSGAVNNTNNATVMVEMGTSTTEDHLHKTNDLALSYSYWNVEDDENEDTIARLGIFQLAGSHKSYHSLLKYCLNSDTIADTAVIIVLDWTKPWSFMETLQRWSIILEGAVEQVCQEGAAGVGNWSKGKALVDDLREKLTRYLQEYTEPQSHSTLGGSTVFNDSQTFGSNDAVLLPLTEGSLTTNTGVPIIVVCTKSDHINQIEREMAYKEETFDYIQQSLRTICLKYGASLFYTSIHYPHTYANLRQYLLHRLLTPSSLSNAPQTPSSFPFKKRAQVVERDQVMVPAGWDSFGKIKVLRSGFDCEGLANGWDMNINPKAAMDAVNSGAEPVLGARQVYEEVIVNPQLSHAPATVQPLITAEDDQVFLERFYETLQRANERSASNGMGIGMGGGMMGGSSMGGEAPPVVGPLGSGYTSMLNSHNYAASPPPSAVGGGRGGSASVTGATGAPGSGGANGYDADDVEARFKRLTSKQPSKKLSSSLLGPALTGTETAGASGAAGGVPGVVPGGGYSQTALNMRMMMGAGGSGSGAAGAMSPPLGSSAAFGGMAGSNSGLSNGGSSHMASLLSRSAGGGAGAVSGTGTVGDTSSARLAQAGQNEAVLQFFQSLMNRKPGVSPALMPGGATGSPASAAFTPSAAAAAAPPAAPSALSPSVKPNNAE